MGLSQFIHQYNQLLTPTMIERSTTSIMAVKTVIMIVQIHNGARREKERVRSRGEGVRVQLGYSGIRRDEERVRRRREGGYIEGTGRIQW